MHGAEPKSVESLQALLQWERDAQLFDYRCLGVAAWRLVRKGMLVSHLAARGVRGKANYNRRGFSQAVRMAGGAALSLLHLASLRPRRYLFVGFPRRRLENGLRVDPFCDPLIALLGEDRSLCIEKPFAGRHFRPARTRHLIYYDGLMVLSVALSRLTGWIVQCAAPRQVRSLAAAISARLEIDERTLRRSIARAVAAFWIESTAMTLVLAVIRPQRVLLTSRWVHAAIIHACKRRKIMVCELQHGTVPVAGYAYATRFDPQLDPDWMLTFGSYWKRFGWGVPPERVLAIGYRYIWQRREAARNRPLGARVMFISKPGRYADLARWFRLIAGRHPHISFVLRLHPQDVDQWQQRYPIGDLANITVSYEARADLYDTFIECCAVVGYDSTVHSEAAFFGLKVGILNDDLSNASPALEFAGRANFFEIRSIEQFDAMLEAPAQPSGDSPFFAEFAEEEFIALMTGAAS